MTGFHPYCVVPADRRPEPGLRGLEDAPVEALRVAGLSIWVSALESEPTPSVPSLRTHDRVIRAAARAGEAGPLPVRFGGWAGSRETLRRRVRERHELYRDAMERLGDAREFGLRVLDVGGESAEAVEALPAGEASSGREYMERLARRHAERSRRDRRAEEILGSLREAVGETARDERVERPDDGSALLGVAHLVRREDVGAYRARIDRFRRDRPRLRAVPTGPWAAYSFAP